MSIETRSSMNPKRRAKEAAAAAAGERVERTAPRSDEQHRRSGNDIEWTPDRIKQYQEIQAELNRVKEETHQLLSKRAQ